MPFGYTRVEMMDGTLLQAGDVKFNILPSDWVAPDTGPTSEQLHATSASADENQAIFSTQLKQQTTAREGSSYFDGGLQDQKVLTGESYQYVIPENLFASLGANATYELTQASGAPLPSWLHFDSATNTLYGTPTKGQLGSWQIKISGYQGSEEIQNLSDGGQFNLSVAESNQAPTAYGTVPVQYANEGNLFSLEIAPNFFIDNDTGDRLSYSVTLTNGEALPEWLNFDTHTLRLFGTPDDADVGVLDLTITVKDSANATEQSHFALVVEAINDAPTLNNPVSIVQMQVDQANAFTLPQDMFVDTDLGDSLSIEVKLVNSATLPDWLHFDAATLTLSATPTHTQLAAPIQLQVIATDLFGAKAATLITLTAAIWGSDANDILTGSLASETLWGLNGNDTLIGNDGADRLIGGTGNDTYIADNFDTIIENDNEGNDTVQTNNSWVLGSMLENLTLTGTLAINGTGNGASNIIMGNSAANILDGGIGTDTMIGGLGNDTYVVDNINDVVIEISTLASEIDSIQSGVSYTLSANVESIILTGTDSINGTGNELNNILVGNIANNILLGGAGNDTLDGDAGEDTMSGGAGNDIYCVENIADIIIEADNEGIDTVLASISFGLAAYANVENVSLTGIAPINATGNALNNVLTGNGSNNRLEGGAGNDILNGEAGIDIMIGGNGNDTYVVDDIADIVTESSNEGIDLVNIAIVMAGGTYALGANVESGTLTNAITYNLTGNILNNILVGNVANNTLDGGLGADTLIGGASNDTYIVDNMGDVVIETDASTITGGTDLVKVSIATSGGTYTLSSNLENATLTNTVAYSLTGNAQNNVLTGNNTENIIKGYEGNDTLNGGLGRDFLIGGQGNDLFTFSSPLSGANIDVIGDFIRGTDRIVLDATIFTKLLNDTNLTDNIVVSSFGSRARDMNDYLLFNSSTKALYYDADGSGFNAPIQFATLINVATVSANDFVVI